MSEPSPTWAVSDPPAPAYDEQVYLANMGRTLIYAAGYCPAQRPPAIVVRLALRRQGLLTEAMTQTCED